jgi:hypothetical protein
VHITISAYRKTPIRPGRGINGTLDFGGIAGIKGPPAAFAGDGAGGSPTVRRGSSPAATRGSPSATSTATVATSWSYTLFSLSAPLVQGVHVWRYDTGTTSWSLFASWYFDQPHGLASTAGSVRGRTVSLTSSDHTRILFSMAKVLKKVTVNLPPDILDGACRFTGKGITPTIIQGLLELERRAKRSALRGLRGKVRFELDLDATRR